MNRLGREWGDGGERMEKIVGKVWRESGNRM